MRDSVAGPYMSATRLRDAALRGEVSCVEIVDAQLARIERLQPRLNAYAEVCAGPARARAAELDARRSRGEPLGALFGVPFSVKDILNTAGVPTRWGSKLMRDNVPVDDAVAVARLRAADAILLGKTTTSEFAHSMMGRSPLTGLTVNPWNAAVTSGGSSCGAGVAVASGQGPLALATDAGASTRLPAACNGIVGLKPTLGAIPHNQVPDGFGNFIHLGLMARSVADVALMLDVVSGAHASDPHSIARAPTRAVDALLAAGGLSGKRVGVLRRVGNRKLDPTVEAALDEAARTMAGMGARVSEIDYTLDSPEPAWRALQQMNWAARFAAQLDKIRDSIDPSYAQGIAEGAALSGLELQRAIQKRTELFRAVQVWFREMDLVLSPVMSRPPLDANHGVLEPITIAGETVGDMRREWTPYLSLFDLTGHPAVSLPAGHGKDGVPLGVQLVGRWHEDAGLLAAAAAYEAAVPWAGAVPPLD